MGVLDGEAVLGPHTHQFGRLEEGIGVRLVPSIVAVRGNADEAAR